MAPRANWKGYLKLSLVSCPVSLYPASSKSEKISFHRVNKQTGNRLKQILVDSKDENVVESENQAKGYETGKNEYILMEDEELDNIKLESTHTIEIDSFVPKNEIDTRYLSAPYYIVPNDKVGQEAFAVIRNAIKAKRMVAIAHVVLQRREHIIALEPLGKGLMGTTLRFANEVRNEDVYFEDIPDLTLSHEMTQLATQIVNGKAAHFEPEKFVDRYETALIELVHSKQTTFVPTAKPVAKPHVGPNIMEALRASVSAANPNLTKEEPKKKSRKKMVA